MSRELDVVLFDLDGTLADTAPDLAKALNQTLEQQGRTALPFDMIRPVVSLGGAAMIELGFGITDSDPLYESLRKQFLDNYFGDIAHSTRLFAGMDEVLMQLEKNRYQWGIVTNKPGWLTAPLLAALDLDERPGCVVSGDTLPERKPHPAPLLHACKLLSQAPDTAVYVGDARRDMEAGRNAGMKTVIARYGYISNDEKPESWGADTMIDSPLELLDWLKLSTTG